MLNEPRQTETSTRQYATFSVGDLFLGVDVVRVQEVLRFQEMTPVPRAGAAIGGLINLRGRIVTAFDLRHRLGIAPHDPGREPMNVVVRHEDEVVSLLVDEIGDVIEVDSADFEAVPETIDPRSREILEGVYKLENRLLLALSPEKAFDA